MATEEELNIQRNLNEELQRSVENMRQLSDSQRDVLFFTRDYADAAKDAAKAVYENSIQVSETSKAFKDVANAAKKITDNYAEVISGEKAFQDLAKEELALARARSSFQTEYEQFLQTAGVSQENINGLLDGTINTYDAINVLGDENLEANFKLLEIFQLQAETLQEEADNMAKISERAQNIEASMKVFGKDSIGLADAADGISKGFSKAGLGNLSDKLGLGEAVKDTRKFASSLTEGGKSVATGADKMAIMKNFAGNLAGNLTKALGPAALIAMAIDQIVKAFKLIDNSSGEVAKNMGISAESGRQLVASSADAAAMSGDLLVSTKDVVAAQMALNTQFGTSVKFAGDFAAEFASIQERTGLSSEAMGKFAEQALLTGTSLKDQVSSISDVTTEMSAQSGIMLNQKDIQEGLKDVSDAQRLINKFNTKELANQVFQTKLLGVSQSQLESMGSKLLDFESSIAAEMEAELLTGKQLNLEGARQAALLGDQAALASELKKEVGSAAEFGELNVIQQEAMAKAVGLSRDEMASMLVEQEKLEAIKRAGFESTSAAQEAFNKLVEDGMTAEQAAAEMKRRGIDDAFAEQMKSTTQQEKLNAAMEKLTDLFVQIVDPLMPLVDAITDILNPIFAILSPIIKLIGDLVGLIMTTLNPTIQTVQKLFNNLGKGFTEIFGGIGKIIEGIINLDFSMLLDGFKSIAKGAIQLILLPFQALTDLVTGTINGMIDMINYIPGVDINPIPSIDLAGEVSSLVGLAEGGIVTKPTKALIGEGGEPEAVIPLSKASSMGFSSENEDIKQTNSLLKELITAVKQGGDVYIDGAKAGKSLALATSKMG